MNSERRPLYLVLVIGVFFVAGLITVLLGGEDGANPSEPLPPDDSGSVLILGVDDMGAEDPQLVAVWHATFSPQNRDLVLFGEAIDRPVCADQLTTLSDLFQWSSQSGLSQAFLEAFSDPAPGSYVVLDEFGFAAVIDELEGVVLDGTQLQGDQVVAVLRTLYGNPSALLTSQEQFLIALGERLPSVSGSIDLNRLLELMPEHAYTSVPPQDLLTLYLGLQPLEEASILIYASVSEPIDC